MTSRRFNPTLALLLPLMVLRAMLPAGYMPVAEHGELRIVLCSAGLALPSGDTHNDGDHPSPGGADCPFAHAAVMAPPVQYVVAVVTAPRELRFQSQPATQLPPATGPPRATTARAPPALS